MKAAIGGEWLSRDRRQCCGEDADEAPELLQPPPGPLIERLDAESLAAVAQWMGLSVAELVVRYSEGLAI